ncbi:MAG: tail fiber domain-containing protein [Saprospiraceae bacterium]
MITKILVFVLSISFISIAKGQIVSIFESATSFDSLGSNPSPDAMLDIKSDNKGLLIPRLTALRRMAIQNPSNGLLVYDIDSSAFFYSKNADWKKIAAGAELQGLPGPDGPQGPQGFIGPTGAGGSTHMSGTNFFVGTSSGTSITSGLYNSFAGYYSGTLVSTGGFNAYLGGLSGSSNNGSFNVGIGYRSGGTVGQTGTIDHNVSIGSVAGAKLTDASYNVLLGSGTASHLNNGNNNVMIGYATGSGITTANDNIYIGNSVANSNTNGASNTIIGNEAGKNLTTSSGNILIGYRAGSLLSNENNKLIVENSSGTTPLLYGDFTTNALGVNWNYTQTLPNTFTVNGTASKAVAGDWLANSDARLKSNITHLSSQLMLAKLLQMQGVSFQWDDNDTGFERPEGAQYGFIAQDIEKIWPNNVLEDSMGYKMTSYGTYDFLYVESIKALHKKNESLKSEVEKLQERIKNIEALLSN